MTEAQASATGLAAYLRTLCEFTVAGMGGAIGVALTVATALLPPEDGKVEVGVAAVLACLGATYFSWRAERLRANALALRVAGQGRLAFEFLPGESPFEEDRTYGLYDMIKRVFSVRITNFGGSTVSKCRVWLVSVEPYDGNFAREIMLPGFERDLHAGDGLVVKLASFEEGSLHMGAATMGLLHVPLTDSVPSVGDRTIGMEHGTYTVKLKATGDGSAPVEASFKLWFTEPPKPKLRMQMLAGNIA